MLHIKKNPIAIKASLSEAHGKPLITVSLCGHHRTRKQPNPFPRNNDAERHQSQTIRANSAETRVLASVQSEPNTQSRQLEALADQIEPEAEPNRSLPPPPPPRPNKIPEPPSSIRRGNPSSRPRAGRSELMEARGG